LDFGRTCADSNLEVVGSVCQDPVEPFASVYKVTLLEYNVNYQIIDPVGHLVEGNFTDGDTIAVETLTAGSVITNEAQLPMHWELYIDGNTADGELTSKLWSVHFTQDCGAYPFLEGGEILGITQFTDLVAPPSDVCGSSPGRRMLRG